MIKKVEINLEGNFAKSLIKLDGEEFPVTDVRIEYHTGDIPKITLTFPASRVEGMIKEGKLEVSKDYLL